MRSLSTSRGVRCIALPLSAFLPLSLFTPDHCWIPKQGATQHVPHLVQCPAHCHVVCAQHAYGYATMRQHSRTAQEPYTAGEQRMQMLHQFRRQGPPLDQGIKRAEIVIALEYAWSIEALPPWSQPCTFAQHHL